MSEQDPRMTEWELSQPNQRWFEVKVSPDRPAIVRINWRRAALATVAVLAAELFIAGAVAGRNLEWAGMADRTLWDWMDLLLVPAVLAVGGLLFSRAERRSEREIADQRRKDDRAEAEDRTREEAFQRYLDRMGDLLIDGRLKGADEESSAPDVARTFTLATLRRLDAVRKGDVIQFLRESGLIKAQTPVVLLSGADLREADLSGANLSGANLSGANLFRADLTEADLREANLSGADLPVAVLSAADLRGADLRGAILIQADLYWANLSMANLGGAKLIKADLSVADLHKANLRGADLSGANLSEADLRGADLGGTNLGGARLSGAHLNEANLSGADLSGAALIGADLLGANLSRANLSGADLRTNLSEADLSDAIGLPPEANND